MLCCGCSSRRPEPQDNHSCESATCCFDVNIAMLVDMGNPGSFVSRHNRKEKR